MMKHGQLNSRGLNHMTKSNTRCVDCGKKLSPINWKKAGLKPTKEVRCNECGMKQWL